MASSPLILNPPLLQNLATNATPSASSIGLNTSTTPPVPSSAKYAIDGTDTAWLSNDGGATSWLNLTFPEKALINTVYLYDLPDSANQIASGLFNFSDGRAVAFGPLNNDGTATIINFPDVSTSFLLFTITGVSSSTTQIGLTEIQVYDDASVDTPFTLPTSDTVTASYSSVLSPATDTSLLSNIVTVPPNPASPVPVAPDASSTTVAPASSGIDQHTDAGVTKNKEMPTVIGAVVGGIAFLVIMMLLLSFLMRDRHRTRGSQLASQSNTEPKTEVEDHTMSQRPESDIDISPRTSTTLDHDPVIFFDPQAVYDLSISNNNRRLSTIPSSHFYPDGNNVRNSVSTAVTSSTLNPASTALNGSQYSFQSTAPPSLHSPTSSLARTPSWSSRRVSLDLLPISEDPFAGPASSTQPYVPAPSGSPTRSRPSSSGRQSHKSNISRPSSAPSRTNSIDSVRSDDQADRNSNASVSPPGSPVERFSSLRRKPPPVFDGPATEE